jgi:hypothetical protein
MPCAVGPLSQEEDALALLAAYAEAWLARVHDHLTRLKPFNNTDVEVLPTKAL